MSKELQKEFAEVVGAVARDVSENVVKNTALKSVEKLNRSLQELKEEVGGLVSDIREAQNQYSVLAKESGQTLTEFNSCIESWSKQQEKIQKQFAVAASDVDKAFQQQQRLLNQEIERTAQQFEKQQKQQETVAQKRYAEQITHFDKLLKQQFIIVASDMDKAFQQQETAVQKRHEEQIANLDKLLKQKDEFYVLMARQQEKTNKDLEKRIKWTIFLVLVSVAVSGAALWLLH